MWVCQNGRHADHFTSSESAASDPGLLNRLVVIKGTLTSPISFLVTSGSRRVAPWSRWECELVPSNARVDDIGARGLCDWAGTSPLPSWIPRHKIQHAQPVHDGEIGPTASRIRLRISSENGSGVQNHRPICRCVCWFRAPQAVDQITFRPHDLTPSYPASLASTADRQSRMVRSTPAHSSWFESRD